MKIRIADIEDGSTFKISGAEPWLKEIYDTFPNEDSEERALIKGELTVHFLGEETIKVSGHLTFNPNVNCSRCDLRITWPVSQDVDVIYLLPPEKERGKDVDDGSDAAKFTEYFCHDGELDMEQLINDALQTAMPSRFIRVADEGTSCAVCFASLAQDLVYSNSINGGKEVSSSDKNQSSSPFKILKGGRWPR